MNDRLKDLMLEAGYAAPELAGRANKFAELIVAECISIAQAGLAPAVVTVIKERFGVEL
jgi:hypothetical protein